MPIKPTKPPPTLMVVEDDADASYLMGRYARTSGCRSVNLRYGEDVSGFAQQVRPALILLDLELPGISGWEVLEALKADPVTCQIPVVICSARDEVGRAQEAGAIGYLLKPIGYQDFLDALKEAGVESAPGTPPVPPSEVSGGSGRATAPPDEGLRRAGDNDAPAAPG